MGADVHPEWVDQLTDDCKPLMEAIESARYAHSDGMGAFMCFMAVRLLEMRRVLRPTGSIYLHCDPTASHYLKAVMDAVYGYNNFRSDITWRRINPTGRVQNALPTTQTIFSVMSRKEILFGINNTSPMTHLIWIDSIDT